MNNGNRINHDPLNPLLYTNRSMALLKLSLYTRVITDSQHAISLSSPNTAPKPSLYPSPNSSIMKAYFQLAQAQIALHDPVDALKSAKKAHELCVDECAVGGKGASSIGPITELVLRCKREAWERKEAERLRSRPGLLVDVLNVMEKQRDAEISNVTQAGNGEEGRDGKRARLRGEWETKMEDVRKVFEKAGEDKEKRREVPDWAVDDITFAVMLDPVVVCPLSFPHLPSIPHSFPRPISPFPSFVHLVRWF